MLDINIEEIKGKIERVHSGDDKQLEVIFSNESRIIVEAPAGYGKTTTMISRIAYLFASEQIPNPKRILGLTFSVNAALKVKREVAEKLPLLLGRKNNPMTIGKKVAVTNYHGFCKGILTKYGYLISSILRKDINLFTTVTESDLENQEELKIVFTAEELNLAKSVKDDIKKACMPSSQTIYNYNDIIVKKLLPLGYITHNAVILFVLEIFDKFEEIKKFYQSYYPLVVVDEFQDTNCIAWALLQSVISNHTQLLFLGDSLQRIYGFIGALPNIMLDAAEKYKMTKVSLSKNYRFRNNPEMLKLDKNIRANASSCFGARIVESDVAKLPAFWGKSQYEESKQIAAKVQELCHKDSSKVAILFCRRGRSTDIMETELSEIGIDYFYGMFTDNDAVYVEFHNKCQNMFIKKFGKSKSINKKTLIAFSNGVKAVYASASDKAVDSLLRLLDALIEKVSIDYADLTPEDKYTLLLDIFENRQLKQAMEYVDSQVILSTIHGAKGLEWEYVMICDVEQWVFTFKCNHCPNPDKNKGVICKLPNNITEALMTDLLDDFCVFYVALTRAKKQAYVSASRERFNSKGQQSTNGRVCCFANVDGIKLIDAAKNDD